MSKRLIILLLVVGALLSLGMRVVKPADMAVEADFAKVSRHSVHKVKAIAGRLGYADEKYVISTSSGVISKICVQSGQRVAANDALVRLDMPSHESVLSSILKNEVTASALNMGETIDTHLLSSQNTIRCETDCTVRQILVEEGAAATIGTPLLRLSSQEQIIHCAVLPLDAKDIDLGQWAWIYASGEAQGMAEVTAIEDSEMNAVTGLLETVVTLKPTQHVDLAEGTGIDVEIFLSGSDDVLSLPVEAITERGTVWWVNQGRCTEIPAEIVLSDEIYAWVNLPEGLLVAIGEFEEGQRVVEATE